MKLPASTQPTLLGRLSRIIRTLNAVAAQFAHLALWLLVAVVLYDVGLRSLGSPPVWGSEVSVYLMLSLAFLGIGPTAVENGHFRVTVLVGRLGLRAQRTIDFVCTLLALVFTVFFTYGAYKLAAFSFQLNFTTPTVLKMPVGLIQALVFVGGAFLALALIHDLLRIVSKEECVEHKTDIWAE